MTRPAFRLAAGRTISTLGAGAVTAGLFLLMAGLIAEEFQPEDRTRLEAMELNPKVEDIVVMERIIRPAIYQPIEVPPPPPVVDIAQTPRPTEPIVDMAGRKPDFKPTEISFAPVTIVESDRNVQPIHRIPPQMPPRAERSGHCKMRFNVSAEGQPYDVTALSCSQSLFERASVRSVQSWRYRPKVRDGRPVSRTGVETKITFNLADERGQLIPE